MACLAKIKVYIEDAASNEMVINNVPCRKLGDLKNGEEKTFVIDDNEAKIFVIADALSKGYCNEFCTIPAGTEDVVLNGENKYNPANGNAFRFDGVTDETILQNRKKSTKKGTVVLIAACIIGILIGATVSAIWLSGKKDKSKEFSSDGMTITLTDEFVKTSMAGFTVCYDSKDVAVFALKEDFSIVDGLENYTIHQYGDAAIKNNNLGSSVKLKTGHGLVYAEYEATNPETKEAYSYFIVFYKTSDSFWLVQFCSLTEKYQDNRKTFIDWAKKVEFSS